jgi:glycosyltransferase 2 family protein
VPQLNLHLRRTVPLIIFLALVVHFLLPRLGALEHSAAIVPTMALWAILAALAAQLLSYISNGAVLQSIVRVAGGELRLGRAAVIEVGAATISLVAAGPVGFGAAIYKWVSATTTIESATVAAWLPGVFDTSALILAALVSAFELLHVHQLSRATEIALIGVISVLVVVMIGAFFLVARPKLLVAIARRFHRTVDPDAVRDAWMKLRGGAWAHVAIRSILTIAFDMLTLYFAFAAAHQPLRFSLLLAGYGVPILLGRTSFLPGGIAVIEVGMSAVFAGLGIDTHVAIVGVLTYRLISFWLPTLIGIPVAIALNHQRPASSSRA